VVGGPWGQNRFFANSEGLGGEQQKATGDGQPAREEDETDGRGGGSDRQAIAEKRRGCASGGCTVRRALRMINDAR
jgi:hypothetical protein